MSEHATRDDVPRRVWRQLAIAGQSRRLLPRATDFFDLLAVGGLGTLKVALERAVRNFGQETNMKLRNLSLCAAVLAVLLSPLARAQLGKPIDPTKKADVGEKSVSFGEARFNTLSQPTRDLSNAALTKGNLKFQEVDTKGVELNSLQFSSVATSVIPKANFTAKRIAEKVSDESTRQLDHVKKKAPINERQIRAFAPAGEEELKKQFKEPH